MRIGFIGLGKMGGAMAANLLTAGHTLSVWNRSPDKAAPLVAQGAARAASPAEAAAGAEIVVTMLADDAALEAVVFGEDGFLAARPDLLHVSMSTVSVALAARLTQAHRGAGGRFVSAPVFGRPAAAQAAELVVLAAGEPDARADSAPVFDAVGRRTFAVGDTPSAANLVKLCGNFMIMASIEAMAEATTLAGNGGVDRRLLLDILTETLFAAPVFRNYGPAIVEERYRPAGFTAPLGLKDMRLVGEAAKATGTVMPVRDIVDRHLRAAIALEGDDIDWAGAALAVQRVGTEEGDPA